MGLSRAAGAGEEDEGISAVEGADWATVEVLDREGAVGPLGEVKASADAGGSE